MKISIVSFTCIVFSIILGCSETRNDSTVFDLSDSDYLRTVYYRGSDNEYDYWILHDMLCSCGREYNSKKVKTEIDLYKVSQYAYTRDSRNWLEYDIENGKASHYSYFSRIENLTSDKNVNSDEIVEHFFYYVIP